jgi:hypothetical protein
VCWNDGTDGKHSNRVGGSSSTFLMNTEQLSNVIGITQDDGDLHVL